MGRHKKEVTIFKEGKLGEILFALRAAKIETITEKSVTFILTINECIDSGKDLSIKQVYELYNIIYSEQALAKNIKNGECQPTPKEPVS